MDRLQCNFLIPIVRNSDKRPHQQFAWRALVDALYDMFDGDSGPRRVYLVGELVRGDYRDAAGNRIEDESREYFVALASSAVPTLREVLTRACRTFDQDCLYLNVAGKVEFVTASVEGLEVQPS